MSLDPSTLGGLHTLASLLAILAGLLVLVLPKGTAAHRLRGRAYLFSMLVTNLAALGLYNQGGFGFAHWMTVLSLVLLLTGFAALRLRRPAGAWLRLHAGAMAASYFLLLFAGINEAFFRLDFLIHLGAKFELLQPAILLALLAVAAAALFYLLRVTARRVAAGG